MGTYLLDLFFFTMTRSCTLRQRVQATKRLNKLPAGHTLKLGPSSAMHCYNYHFVIPSGRILL